MEIAIIPKNAGERIQVDLFEYKGHDLLGVRVYANTGAEWVPTRKGITVRVGLIPELAQAMLKAKSKAEEIGMLDPTD